MIYKLIKLVGTMLMELFFRRISVRGEPLVQSGPLMIVANHPNFLFDPALLGLVYKRPLWFLAKGTLFSWVFLNWFLRAVHMVPIYRRQDNPVDMQKNTDTFQFAATQLAKDRAIALFPEGASLGERKLLPIKTGAARIALQAESEFACGLQMQPVGITYANLSEFQTTVTVVGGAPIAVAPFVERYKENEREAVSELTAVIDESLRAVTVEIVENDDRELAELIGKLYSSHGATVDDRALLSAIVENIDLAAGDDGKRQSLLLRLRWYKSLAEALGLDPGRPSNKSFDVFVLSAVPFVLLGIIFHIIPYRLVGALVSRRGAVSVETATMKLVFGILLFAGWYGLSILALFLCAPSCSVVLAVFMLLVGSGYFALKWTHECRLLLAGWLAPGSARARQTLLQLNSELYEECEQFRRSRS